MTDRTKRSPQRGFFIPPGYFILAAILAVVIGIGVFMYNRNKAATPSLGSTGQSTETADPVAKINNFYDCFETDGRTYRPGKPNKCTAKGKTFEEPTRFTDDNVRDAAKLPVGVRGQVFTEAATSFRRCAKEDQDEANVPVTQVLSVLGNDWTYVAVSCETSVNKIYQKQPDGSWLMVDSSIQKIGCPVVDTYGIPKELFLTSSNENDHDTVCIKTDGSESQIVNTYKPSGLDEDQTNEAS